MSLLGDVDRGHVMIVVVDADGRLHPSAPRYAASHFADPEVGGVQALVKIYNRHHLLTWMQDEEFSVYGHLYQSGRDRWGTAGMGGNGQFNRLSALDAIADQHGPWRDRLTEDQDLGLRMIAAGWEGRQELRAVVEQQGLPALRPLLRQRTRWSQGNLQAMGLIGEIRHAPLRGAARVDLLAYLMLPVLTGGGRRGASGGPRASDHRHGAVLGRGTVMGPGDRVRAYVRRDDPRLCFCVRRQGPIRVGERMVDRPSLCVLQLAAVACARPLHGAPAHEPTQLGQDTARVDP